MINGDDVENTFNQESRARLERLIWDVRFSLTEFLSFLRKDETCNVSYMTKLKTKTETCAGSWQKDENAKLKLKLKQSAGYYKLTRQALIQNSGPPE